MARPNKECRTNIEANILTQMAEAGISSYAELAAKAGTTQTTLQRICSGVVSPSLPTLQKLARVLKCKVDDLLEEDVDGEASPDP